jgi:GMP synthase-like glutamine amidotransferase
MRVAAIKNYPTEELGYIEEIFEEKGIEYFYIEAYKETPEFESDAIIVLGGPMGVYEKDQYPFLEWEMEIIRKNYSTKPILGICLGAQLIAGAFNMRVYPFKKEIGWKKVFRVEDDALVRNLPDVMEVFQWHGDTFDLPDGAKLLYSGYEVKNQCFRIGKTLAIQFHLEMTLEMIEDWLQKSKLSDEEKEKISAESKEKIAEHNRLCEILMDNFLDLLETRSP